MPSLPPQKMTDATAAWHLQSAIDHFNAPRPLCTSFLPGCVTRMKRFFCAERKGLLQTKKARKNDKRVR